MSRIGSRKQHAAHLVAGIARIGHVGELDREPAVDHTPAVIHFKLSTARATAAVVQIVSAKTTRHADVYPVKNCRLIQAVGNVWSNGHAIAIPTFCKHHRAAAVQRHIGAWGQRALDGTAGNKAQEGVGVNNVKVQKGTALASCAGARNRRNDVNKDEHVLRAEE